MMISLEANESDGRGADINNIIADKASSTHATKVFTCLEIGGTSVKFQLDTGASCNIIGRHHLPTKIELHPTSKVLTMYNRSTIIPLGLHQTIVRNPKTNTKHSVEFVVIEAADSIPLLRARTCQAMDLIVICYDNMQTNAWTGTDRINAVQSRQMAQARSSWSREDILKTYADVFNGELGKFEGEAHLEVDHSVPTVRLPLRKVPLALQHPLEEELKRLEACGVIVCEERPTDWLSSLVVVPKTNGKIHLCIDPKPLNKALKRSHHPSLKLDELWPKLARAKVFSVCDVKNGYWHVQLDEESSLLTTFATPTGRYRWRRLPFGVAIALELFQAKMDRAMAGLKRVSTIMDDMIIWGEGETMDEAENNHNKNLQAMLERCREKGLKLNPEKFRYHVSQTAYAGHLLSVTGLKPDPAKVAAIERMDTPNDKAALQRFLGMVNYLAKFVPHLSDLCQPLRQLLQKDSAWVWSQEHSQAVKDVKAAITRAPTLQFFDERKEVSVQTDVSSTGLGAALLQEGQPVAYTSRALTRAEQGYSQIEKELLAVVFALERFDHYVYGRRVRVQSDHKPLEIISNKPIITAPKRLQRMLLRLQRYDHVIKYKPGKEMVIADTLSRAYGMEQHESVHMCSTQSAFEKSLEAVNALDDVRLEKEKVTQLKEATAQDSVLADLIDITKHGWPQEKMVAPQMRPYFHHRDEIVEADGLLF